MTFYHHLLDATAGERAAFGNTPIIRHALENGVSRELYIAYLTQAYHHVKYTCPLLALAAARCPIGDGVYREALFEYIDEEKGHEQWILNVITAIGADAEAARNSAPNLACQAMVGYVHYATEHVSPYAMLGMVHVLEGMSVQLADAAASSIRLSVGAEDGKGFSYLTSHGAIDQHHVAFFETLVNGITEPAAQTAIIETARVVYKLFGDMFEEIAMGFGGLRDAA